MISFLKFIDLKFENNDDYRIVAYEDVRVTSIIYSSKFDH